MLIKAYGQFWNPDIIDWGRPGAGGQGHLPGETTNKKNGNKYNIDYWKARGIYILHSEFNTVYVGQAFDTKLGPRLRNHLTDRFMGRWDMFSWFSVSSPRFTTLDVSDGSSKRPLHTRTIVNTLEALGILVADPALNRKRERFQNAYEAFQPKDGNIKSIRSYLENILEGVNTLNDHKKTK